MKFNIFLFGVAFLCTATSITAQRYIQKNLVPNASFEQLIELPIRPNKNNFFELEPKSGYIPFKKNLAFWKSANTNTPDLRIITNADYQKLDRRFGYAVRPRTGTVMVGLITYMSNHSSDTYREFLLVKLKHKLKPKVKTFCELWICKDRKAKLVANNIGFYFARAPLIEDTRENLKVKPQVNHREIINKDGQKWEKITGHFYPDMPYQFLTIGNFYNNDSTQQMNSPFHSADPRLQEYASYLIDDIRVWQENDTIEEVPAFDITRTTPMVLQNINFETNSARLLASSNIELEKLLSFLKKNHKTKIAIHGHTDSVGSDDFNLDLSKRRADAVIHFLIEKGISQERLSTEGFGEQKPIDDNNTAAGRLNNRRVEFIILS